VELLHYPVGAVATPMMYQQFIKITGEAKIITDEMVKKSFIGDLLYNRN
jgi:hypothetical protein